MSEPILTRKISATSETVANDVAAHSVESDQPPQSAAKPEVPGRPRELGGPAGPDPTRYGDWERKGRCIDF